MFSTLTTRSTRWYPPVKDDSNVWRDEVFALLLDAWVTMAEDPEVRRGGDAVLREGMEELTFPLFEQYVAHELTVRSVGGSVRFSDAAVTVASEAIRVRCSPRLVAERSPVGVLFAVYVCWRREFGGPEGLAVVPPPVPLQAFSTTLSSWNGVFGIEWSS